MSQKQGHQDRAKKLKKAYHTVFESEDGKLVLFDLMDSCNLTGSTLLDAQCYEPLAMAYGDGQKAIVHRIMRELAISPEKYLELIQDKQAHEEEQFELD